MKYSKGVLTKTILKGILFAGGIAIASTSPVFVSRAIPALARFAIGKLKRKKRSFYDVFSYLKRKNLLVMENRKGQLFISLTPEGKKIAGKYQIDDLRIKKSRKWDGKWRILIFDIKDKERIKREALRGKIKELGLFQLQKSVWIHPYDFSKEIGLLRSFFNLSKDEMKIIIAAEIEEDEKARKFFRLV